MSESPRARRLAPLLLALPVLLGACSGPEGGGNELRPATEPRAPAAPRETDPPAPQTPATPRPAVSVPPPAPSHDVVATRTLDGGIEVEVLTEGKGEAVRAGDVAFVHYTGTLKDGTKFDSSRDRGQPFPVIVGKGLVIPGWDRALEAMRGGDRWRVTVPAGLAYGEKAMGGVIPANSDLVFDMEVVDVQRVKVEVLTEGKGAPVLAGSQVAVHYTGTLLDGKQFDSSRDRGQPFTLRVGAGQVISGWDATLLQMRQGDRWKVTIPWKLAYGERGSPPAIPARADLVFDMEVLQVEGR
jgi:peptidylprolyl isomerase